MKQYSSYIDSGIQWLNEIPAHWKILPGRALFTENKEKNDGGEHQVLSLSYGSIIIKMNVNEGLIPENYSSYQYIRPGYIIVRCTDLQNDKVSLRTSISEYEGIITGAYLGLIPKPICRSKFIHYLLRAWDCSKELYRYGSGLRQSLSWNDFKYVLLPIPTPEEQEAIVAYLDAATAKIDEAIAQQQRMIDLLEERKRIIVFNAVTKGVSTDANMKNSGISWIGEMPIHWNLYKGKVVFRIQCGYPFDSRLFSLEKGSPLIRIRDITSGNIETYYNGLFDNKYLVTRGDLLVGMDGDFSVRWWDSVDALLNQRCCRLFPSNKVLKRFLFYYLPIGLRIINELTPATTVKHLSDKDIKSMPICVPPIEEQQRIVTFLDKQIGRIDSTISNAHNLIDCLRERKQIVINNVVTGKVRVY